MLYYYYIYRATDFGMQWLKTRVFTQGCAFWGLKKLKLTFNPFLCPPKVKFWQKSGLRKTFTENALQWGCSPTNDPQ